MKTTVCQIAEQIWTGFCFTHGIVAVLVVSCATFAAARRSPPQKGNGSMTNQLLTKLGVKQGMRSLLIDAPSHMVEALGLPNHTLTDKPAGLFNSIHVFTTSQEKLDTTFPQLKRQLRQDGMLWVSWPKGKRLGTDLTLKHIIRIGYSHGLVESKTISVDPIWSAIKFTFPKQGEQYNNSYGELNKDAS